jgi:hypothetical protein
VPVQRQGVTRSHIEQGPEAATRKPTKGRCEGLHRRRIATRRIANRWATIFQRDLKRGSAFALCGYVGTLQPLVSGPLQGLFSSCTLLQFPSPALHRFAMNTDTVAAGSNVNKYFPCLFVELVIWSVFHRLSALGPNVRTRSTTSASATTAHDRTYHAHQVHSAPGPTTTPPRKVGPIERITAHQVSQRAPGPTMQNGTYHAR